MPLETGSFTELLDTRLDEMLGFPGKDCGLDHGLWGSCESYELQVILLLELRFFPYDRERRLMDAYHSFFSRRFPEKGCRYLSGMRTLPVSELSRQLGDFRKHLEVRTKVA